MRRMLPLLLLGGCSFGRIQPAECITHAECKGAFGWDQVCATDGFCEPLTLPARCDVEPVDLLDNSDDDYVDAILLGLLWRMETFDTEGRAVQLAVAQANDSGGLDGRLFGLVSCSNEAQPDADTLDGEAANQAMAEFLVEQLGVAAIVGPTSSGETETAFNVANPADTLLLSPSATSPALTPLDGLTCDDTDPGLLWRTAPPDSLQGEVMASYLQGGLNLDIDDPDLSRVAVIYEEGPYGEGLQQAFGDHFTGETVLYPYDASSDRAAELIGELVAEAGDGTWDAVVFIAAAQDQLVSFLQAASVIPEYEDMWIVLADGAYQGDVFAQAANASDLYPNIRGTRPTIDPDADPYRTFAAAYAAWYDEDPGLSGFSAHAWDAAWLAMYGAAWSDAEEGAVTGTGIGRGLRQVSSGTPVEIQRTSWNTVRAAFDAGTPVDVQGASGSLDYDPVTCETTAPIEIWTVEDDGAGGYTFGSKGVVQP